MGCVMRRHLVGSKGRAPEALDLSGGSAEEVEEGLVNQRLLLRGSKYLSTITTSIVLKRDN